MSVAIVIAILAPNFVRRRAGASDGIHSISHFHRQLRVLEHSAPPSLVAPAFRLRAVEGTEATGVLGPTEAPKLTVVKVDTLSRPALAVLGEDPVAPARPSTAPVMGDQMPSPPMDRAGLRPSSARQLTLRRRRDTLSVLALAFVTTGVIGFVPGAQLAWALTVISGVALTGYVAILVHLRRLAHERGRKLHYLAPRQATLGEGLIAGSAMAARFAHPSNQTAMAL
jgi:hypothetical protein